MLRLRPSEITLVPADVEETGRRIESRRPRVPYTSTYPRGIATSVAQSIPKLRQGPQRFRDSALVGLGQIPALFPHYVAEPSSDSNNVDDESHQKSDIEQTNVTGITDVLTTVSIHTDHREPVPSDAQPDHDPNSPSHHFHLPIGLTPQSSPEEDTSAAPPTQPSELLELGLGEGNTPEELSQRSNQSRTLETTDGCIDQSPVTVVPTRTSEVDTSCQYHGQPLDTLYRSQSVSLALSTKFSVALYELTYKTTGRD